MVRLSLSVVLAEVLAMRPPLMKPPTLSLRAWLLGLILLTMLPFLGFSAYMIVGYEHVQQQTAEGDFVDSAQVIAQEVRRRLDVYREAVVALATTKEAETGDIKGLYEQAVRMAGHFPDVTAISLVDPDLNVIFLTSAPLDAQPIAATDSSTLKDVFTSGKAVVSEIFVGPVSRHPVITIGVPVGRDGHIAYVLRIAIPGDTFNQLLAEQIFPHPWATALLDQKGNLVARSADPHRYLGLPAPQPEQAALRAGTQGVFNSVSQEGTISKSVLAKVPHYDWTVQVTVPTSLFVRELRDNLIALAGWSIFISTIAGATALWLAGFIQREVAHLVKSAAALRRGRHPSLRPSTIKEFDHMAHSFSLVNQRERRSHQAYLAVSHQQEATAAALIHARHDSLTGLPGRALFLEMVQKLRISYPRYDMAFLYIDLDGFKLVNDTHGHGKGDEVLRKASVVIADLVRGTDIPARLGGDEFMICLATSPEYVESASVGLASRIIKQVSDIGMGIGCSIGIALWDEGCPDIDTVMRRADDAMYAAKRKGKGSYSLFAADTTGDGSVWL